MSALSIRRLSGALGAEVEDIDIAQDLSDETVFALRQALANHCVLLFRGQSLALERELLFASCLALKLV